MKSPSQKQLEKLAREYHRDTVKFLKRLKKFQEKSRKAKIIAK